MILEKRISRGNLLRNVIIALLIFFSTVTFSQRVELEDAQKAALSKISSLGQSDGFHIPNDGETYFDANMSPLFHLFELMPRGYIAVVTDRRLSPVIAYSFTDNFPVGQDNSLLQLLEKDIHNRLENIHWKSEAKIQKNVMEWNSILTSDQYTHKNRLFRQWPPEGTTSTGGWLETNWSQGAPYNNFCPMDPVTNQRSIAGCPSVAIAMIINYYATLNETFFNDLDDDYYHSYAGRNYWIDDDHKTVDFLSFPELNAYFDTISSCFANQGILKANDKAALTFACGVAARQVYTSSISGTFGVDQAYDAFIRFGFDEAVLLDENDTTIHSRLAQNMMEARPAHLAVIDPGVAGHNLVVDGYNTDGYYHLNFGWGGSYNSWYLIPEEIPYNLTVFEGVILDIAYPPVNTSIHDEHTSETLSPVLWPNPATDEINIRFILDKKENLSIDLYDAYGRNVYSLTKEVLLAGQNNINISLKNDLSISSLNGVYFCRVICGEHSSSSKFIRIGNL